MCTRQVGSSMTRFAENFDNLTKFVSLWQHFEGLFGNWQNFENMGNFLCYLGKFTLL